MEPYIADVTYECLRKMEDSGMSSDQSTTPENSLSQRPSSVGGCFMEGGDGQEAASASEDANNMVASSTEGEDEAARKVGEVEDTDDSDLNNSFHQVQYSHYILYRVTHLLAD